MENDQIVQLKEQLARVEAERDSVQIDAMSYAEQRDTAQAQLAEAVGLLREVYNRNELPLYDDRLLCAFIERHAQAEQQEAQGAQAGDERAAFESAWSKRLDLSRDKLSGCYYSQATEWRWEAWQARAALATQPADGEPVAWLYDYGDGNAFLSFDRLKPDIRQGKKEVPLYAAPPAAAPVVAGEPWRIEEAALEAAKAIMGMFGTPIPAGRECQRQAQVQCLLIDAMTDVLKIAPPAAAHGDETVLWEMLEQLRTATDRQALPGEFIRVMWEAGCDWINARAAMRAQGDGEVQ